MISGLERERSTDKITRLRLVGCNSWVEARGVASHGLRPHGMCSWIASHGLSPQVAPPGLSSHRLIAWVHCIARASKADKPLFMKSMHLPQNDLMSTYRNAQSRLSTPENSPFHAAFVGAWRNSRRGNKLQFCLAGSMKISLQKRRRNRYPRTNKPPLNYLVHAI